MVDSVYYGTDFFFPGNKNLKQRNTTSEKFFGHSTAIMMIAISVLRVVLFAGIFPGNPPAVNHTIRECCISATDHVTFPATVIRTRILSAQKNYNVHSFRRLICEDQMPFVLTAIYASRSGTVHAIHITPAPHPAADPAIFVRAGPDMDLNFLINFIG